MFQVHRLPPALSKQGFVGSSLNAMITNDMGIGRASRDFLESHITKAALAFIESISSSSLLFIERGSKSKISELLLLPALL
jgi:hypothetical protein